MRFVFLLGGILGFALAGGTSFLMERGPDRVFLDGAVGCLAGGYLFRWFWNILLGGLREAVVERQRATAAAAEANASAQPKLTPTKS